MAQLDFCCVSGSLLTVDVMLAEPGVEFEGGVLMTPNADGMSERHPMKQGDAVVFLSHKQHNVEPVTAGTRIVLVAELWEGVEKECPHRCTGRSWTCPKVDFWHCEKDCGFTTNCHDECCIHESACDGVPLTGIHHFNYGSSKML